MLSCASFAPKKLLIVIARKVLNFIFDELIYLLSGELKMFTSPKLSERCSERAHLKTGYKTKQNVLILTDKML